jgi:flagellar L-ring protein precursor FlgH
MDVQRKCLMLTSFLVFLAINSSGHAQDFEKYKLQSLYTDYKAKEIGDIVTILIVESTSGSQNSNADASSQGSFDAQGALSGNLTSFLPLFGTKADISSANNSKAKTSQTDALTGKLTAVVTEILPTGTLALQGTRRMEVNGAKYVLNVRGVARQKDISSENLVMSYNLANVEISYKKDGWINNRGTAGWITRAGTWLFVGGLTLAAAYGIGAAAN